MHSSTFQFVLTPLRPSVLLGKKFEFARSSAFSFMPHTLLHAATGQVLQREIEKRDPRLYSVMLALGRSQAQGSRMQTAMRKELHRALPVRNELTPATVPEMMRGLPMRFFSPWRATFRMRRELGRADRRLVVRLAARERLVATIQRGIEDRQRFEPLHDKLRPAAGYWYVATGLRLQQDTGVLLDECLEHLAWYEAERSRSRDLPYPAQWASDLAEPSEVPMRHWFNALLERTGCDDLPDLAKLLARHGATHSRGEAIEEGLLRKWACGAQSITGENARALVTGARAAGHVEIEMRRFWIAKLLTLFGELVRCFAQDVVEDPIIRRALHSRLAHMQARFQASSPI